MPRLAIVTTHPIQYYAPLFRRLAAREVVEPHVFYGWRGLVDGGRDPGFARDIAWDISLLDGYEHTFVPNESKHPGSHAHDGIASRQLVPMLDAANPDALMVVGWNYDSHLRAMRSFRGRCPLLFRGDSTLLDETPGPRRLARRLALRWIYRNVDVALFTGASNRHYFEAHGVRGDRLAWMPHTVDNERFRDADGAFEREAARWRAELGISSEAMVYLFAGKLESKKAPDLLLRAFESCDATSHLIFAGSGPLEASLRTAARDRANVHFIGFQNQSKMPVVYRLADVFILPSRGPGETWGLAVNEAMASDRPVIVSDRVGCAADLVIPEKTGFTFPSEDGGALSSAMQTAANRRADLLAMRRESRKLIARWSMDVASESIENAVRRVLQ